MNTQPYVYQIRPEIKEALDRYAQDRIPVGDFLTAVLSNELFEAIMRADEGNRRDLREICSYVYNELPSACWGSSAQVLHWLSQRPREERS